MANTRSANGRDASGSDWLGNIRNSWTGRIRVVCLGWGSFIWCQKRLPVTGGSHKNGPNLPVEFARESRDKRITLVICEGYLPVRVLWTALDVATIDEAKLALAVREGVTERNIRHSIGYWSPAGGSGHPGSDVIGQWAATCGFAGVVWTALEPKIGDDYRVPAHDEAINYLNGLRGTVRKTADEYVRIAPRQILTPYRRGIEDALGWTPLGLL